MSGFRSGALFMATSRRRAAIEAGLLACVLMLPLAIVFAADEAESRWSVLMLGAMEIGLGIGVLGALRLRVAPENWSATLRRDGISGLALSGAAGAGVGLAVLAAMAGSIARGARVEDWSPVVTAMTTGVAAVLVAAVVFAFGRVGIRAWVVWDSKRRTRLHWALTHALLAGSTTLAVVVAAVLIAADWRGGLSFADVPPDLPPDAGRIETFVALVTLRYVPAAIALLVISLAVGVIIVPPGALIAFPVLRRATRRLEDLATAAGALRSGDLAARSPVAGEDEIARLQTDFNAMAADLERARDELRAERDAVSRLLDDRRELIAAVSHELRTPVATMRGYLESALAHWRGGPPPTLRDDLAIMTGETERLHRLIDDLFTLSRAEIGQLSVSPQPTAVGALLAHSVGAAAPLAWERGRVEVLSQVADDVPLALVDPARLEQVVRNLIANAVRHTPPGGVVLLTAETDAGDVLIRVKDTGEGIAAADLPHIWDRFFRAASVRAGDPERADGREGAGLGLALVKELTEAMGGTVEVESAPGQGSCFTVRLPVARVSGKMLTAPG